MNSPLIILWSFLHPDRPSRYLRTDAAACPLAGLLHEDVADVGLSGQLHDVEPVNGKLENGEVSHSEGGVDRIAIMEMRIPRRACGLVFAALTLVQGGPVLFAGGIPEVDGGRCFRAELQPFLLVEKEQAAGGILAEVGDLLRARIGVDEGRLLMEFAKDDNPDMRLGVGRYG